MGNLCACGDNTDKLATVESETDNLKEETTTYKAKVEELENLLKATKKKAAIDTKNVISDSLHSPLQKPCNEVGYTSPQNELIALKLRVNELQHLVKKHRSQDLETDEEVGDWVEVMTPDATSKNNANKVASSPAITPVMPLSPTATVAVVGQAPNDNDVGEHSKDNKSSLLSPTSVVIQALNDNDEGEHSKNKLSLSSAPAAATVAPKKNNASVPVNKIK